MHWYLKIPRFDGRKTLAFNGFVFIAASGCQIWLQTGGSPLPVSSTALWLIAAVAGCNLVLRMLTERPVWWRQLSWERGYADEEGAAETVYHRAAEFVERSDFTDAKSVRMQRPEGVNVTNAEFQRFLDKRLCDARQELPLDADERQELPLDADERQELPLDADERQELPLDADERQELPLDADERLYSMR